MAERKVPVVVLDETKSRVALQMYDGAFPLIPEGGVVVPQNLNVNRIARPLAEIEFARRQKPFGDLEEQTKPLIIAMEQDREGIADAFARRCELFLRQRWPMLQENQLGFPISFSVDADPAMDSAEKESIAELKARHQRVGLQNQAEKTLPQLFDDFRKARSVFRMLRQKGLLLPNYVLPDELLPWFTVTAPVWFVNGRTMGGNTRAFMDDDRERFHASMVGRFGTPRLASWFQLWNHNILDFRDYEGDAIPANLLHVMEKLNGVLDYMVIATPYHDMALETWNRPRWGRMVDPYLIGFSKDLPQIFFFLGRWSNTGLFPLAAEMIAHTMAFMREHKPRLAKVDEARFILPEGGGMVWKTVKGAHLVKIADEALKAYDDLRLFPWLTEARPTPSILWTL